MRYGVVGVAMLAVVVGMPALGLQLIEASSNSEFNKLIKDKKSNVVVLVKKEGCSACSAARREFTGNLPSKQIAGNPKLVLADIKKVNNIVDDLDINEVPTTIYFKKGKEVHRTSRYDGDYTSAIVSKANQLFADQSSRQQVVFKPCTCNPTCASTTHPVGCSVELARPNSLKKMWRSVKDFTTTSVGKIKSTSKVTWNKIATKLSLA